MLIEFPLTFQTAAISPEDFLRVIVQEQIRAKLVAAGTDLSFGDRGLGDCKLLKAARRSVRLRGKDHRQGA